MGGEVNDEVEYQDGKCILLYYENIYAMNKDYMYAEIFQRGTKEKKSTNNKYLKERLKVAIQNRVRNVTMVRANKTALAHLTETSMWCFLRTIVTSMVETQNEFIEAT